MLLESMICLALNVYHEAKNQSYVGQVAVAQVVMNRVRDTRLPKHCLLYTSPSPRDGLLSRMPSSA